MGGDNSKSLASPLTCEPVRSNSLPGEVKFLTLNMFLRTPGVKNNKSDYKEERTEYLIKNVLDNYDVLCLQEVFGAFNTRRDRIIQGALDRGFVGYAHNPAPSFFNIQGSDGGLCVLSRFPILESDFWPFDNGVLPDIMAYKGVLYCKLLIETETVHLFCTHAQASYPTHDLSKHLMYKEVRQEQMGHIRRMIKQKVTKSSELVMIMGDFNTDAKEKLKPSKFNVPIKCEYKQMTEILSGGWEDKLSDLVLEAYGYHPNTYGRTDEHGKPIETVLSHRNENALEKAIDYIFAMNVESSNFRVDALRTRVEDFRVTGYDFSHLSDHAGVEAVIVSHAKSNLN